MCTRGDVTVNSTLFSGKDAVIACALYAGCLYYYCDARQERIALIASSVTFNQDTLLNQQ
jgi:hypothetical protein